MDEDEWFAAAQKKKQISLPRNLDGLSTEEMHEYVALLKEEMARTETRIVKQDKTKSAAEALFKKSGD